MINKVSFTVTGDYSSMTLSRDEGSSLIEMQYNYRGGASFARFKLEDLKKAIEILEQAQEPKQEIDIHGLQRKTKSDNSDIEIEEWCDKKKDCLGCTIKKMFPNCGEGWHVSWVTKDENEKLNEAIHKLIEADELMNHEK